MTQRHPPTPAYFRPLNTTLLKFQKDWRPGDWACPSCHFHNFKHRHYCLKCYKEYVLSTREGTFDIPDSSIIHRMHDNFVLAG